LKLETGGKTRQKICEIEVFHYSESRITPESAEEYP
jgi:hypothetical protein